MGIERNYIHKSLSQDQQTVLGNTDAVIVIVMSELSPSHSSKAWPTRVSRSAGEDPGTARLSPDTPPPAPTPGSAAIAWRRWNPALRVGALGVECGRQKEEED